MIINGNEMDEDDVEVGYGGGEIVDEDHNS